MSDKYPKPENYYYERIAPLMAYQRLFWMEEEINWIAEMTNIIDDPSNGAVEGWSDRDRVAAVYQKTYKIRKLLKIIQRDQLEWNLWHRQIKAYHRKVQHGLPEMMGEDRECSDAKRLNQPGFEGQRLNHP